LTGKLTTVSLAEKTKEEEGVEELSPSLFLQAIRIPDRNKMDSSKGVYFIEVQFWQAGCVETNNFQANYVIGGGVISTALLAFGQ
jgi:hypothetical protein